MGSFFLRYGHHLLLGLEIGVVIFLLCSIAWSYTRPPKFTQEQLLEYHNAKNPIPFSSSSIQKGKELYHQHCGTCHGNMGKGDGPAAKFLKIKPRNFTDAVIMGSKSDGDLYFAIANGRNGTAMVSWAKVVPKEERWDLVNYIRTFTRS